MPIWLLIAALATIGVTALLAGVLYRINGPRRDQGGDGGHVPLGADDGVRDTDSSGDGGSNGGGSDGGGGGGD